MLRSGLLAEAGAGRGCLSLTERPSEAITTQHTSHVNTDNYYTVSMLRIMASWSPDWDPAVTAARTDCRHVHHCSALQTADTHLLRNFLQADHHTAVSTRWPRWGRAGSRVIGNRYNAQLRGETSDVLANGAGSRPAPAPPSSLSVIGSP